MPDSHQCHFCGDYVTDGIGSNGERHWLSDCRPDLVEHEPGSVCTWHGLAEFYSYDCYAFQDLVTLEWTGSHSHFYPDGPM